MFVSCFPVSCHLFSFCFSIIRRAVFIRIFLLDIAVLVAVSLHFASCFPILFVISFWFLPFFFLFFVVYWYYFCFVRCRVCVSEDCVAFYWAYHVSVFIIHIFFIRLCVLLVQFVYKSGLLVLAEFFIAFTYFHFLVRRYCLLYYLLSFSVFFSSALSILVKLDRYIPSYLSHPLAAFLLLFSLSVRSVRPPISLISLLVSSHCSLSVLCSRRRVICFFFPLVFCISSLCL